MKNARKLQEFTELKLPPSAANAQMAQQELDGQIAETGAQMAEAERLLTVCRSAYAMQNWKDAAANLQEAVQLWSDNPQVMAFNEQLAADFQQALAGKKKQRERARAILQVFQAGWPHSKQAQEFDADLNRTKDFMAFFDDFSTILIGVISFCVILAFISLKYLAKLFSEA